jgi:mono/diheme cytochrome c family protein
MKRLSLLPLLATAALVSLLAACSTATESRIRSIDLNVPAVIPTPPADGESYPLLPPSAERGADIYAQKCVACHGIGGAGDGSRAEQIRQQGRVVANLVNPARARSVKPSDWHTTITIGRIQNLMPGFNGSLDAQARWDVQAYVWSLGVPLAELDAGRALYAAQCASCHEPSGKPSAAGPDFTDGRWMANISLLDVAGRMIQGEPHAKVDLTEAQRFQVAAAVRALAYVHADPAALRLAKIDGAGTLVLRGVNGTPNGSAAAAAPVILRALDMNGEVFSRTAALDAAGVVTFTGLPQRSDYFYQAELDYAGGRFYGAPTQLLTATAVVSDVLPYYETTPDTGGIRIANVLFAVQNLAEGELTMVEIYEFSHAGERAFVGEDGRTLRIGVPKDAQNLRFDGLGFGKRFVQDGDVIFDTDVVGPGSPAQRITLIYELPYRDGASIQRRMFYPVDRWNVFLPETEGFPGTPLRAASPQLKDEGTRDADSVKVRVYSGAAPTSDALAFDLAGQPLGSFRPGSDTAAIGVALIGLALTIGILFYVLTRVRRLRGEMLTPQQARQRMLRRVAALDDDFGEGKLKPDEYRAARAKLLASLEEVWE